MLKVLIYFVFVCLQFCEWISGWVVALRIEMETLIIQKRHFLTHKLRNSINMAALTLANHTLDVGQNEKERIQLKF